MIKQKLLILTIVIAMAIIGFTTNVYALQSRPDARSLLDKSANYFFTEIRNMETDVLGKTMTLEKTTYKDTSGNGVDVHMSKNTEWGTVALLSASAYGTAPSGASNATTTGNATGVYKMADSSVYEYVAGIWDTTNSNMGTIRNADSRYYNLYTTSGQTISGDALECKKWKAAGYANYISISTPLFMRDVDALFGFSNLRRST